MLIRLILCALFFVAGCSTDSNSSFSDQDRQAISKTMNKQTQAWNRHDLAAFMEYYERSPQLLFSSGGKVRRGWQATLDSFNKKYSQGDRSRMGQLSFELEEISPLGANAAFVLGRFRLTDTPEASEGLFTLIVQRQNIESSWKITHDHTSLLEQETEQVNDERASKSKQ